MVISEKQLQELKSVELEMLKETIKICKDNELKYFLAYGTLLGAVRHKGFIPWDDDIDICMPRRDYEKFIEIAQEALSYPLFLQHYTTDPETLFSFSKIRNSETTYIEERTQNVNMNSGVWIDIFPLDCYSENGLSRLFMNIRRQFVEYRIGKDNYEVESNRGFVKKIFRNMIIMLSDLFYPTLQKANKARDRINKNAKGCRIINYNGPYSEREIFKSDVFDRVIEAEFEGVTVCIPENYDFILSQLYGNYMELPPVEKRKPVHSVIAIDLHKSYKNYLGNR